MQIPTQLIKVLSLFSGMGAPERALEKLGIPFEIEAWSEIDKYAKKAYAILHCDGDESKNLGDITKIDELDLLNLEDVDLITYGFPCQDISLAGLGKGLWEIDALTGERVKTRSGLVWDAHRIIGEVLPKVAICENVKNLTSKKFANEFQAILNSLEDLGYNNYWQVLNAKNYGVPQNRERVFIVSIRKDVDDGSFKFPEPIPLKLRLKDVLDTDVDEKYFISTKGIKYICSPKRGMATDVNAEVAQPLTAKGQQNWTGSFVSPNIDHLEKSSEIGGEAPVTIKMKDGEELVSTDCIIRVGKTKSGGERADKMSARGISSCLSATDYKQPKQIAEDTDQCLLVGNLDRPAYHEFSNRVYSTEGCARTLMGSGGNLCDKAGMYLITEPYNATEEGCARCIKANYHKVSQANLNDKGPTYGATGAAVKIEVVGNYSPSNHDASRIVDPAGIAPTVKENHGTVTGVVIKTNNSKGFDVAEDGDYLSTAQPSSPSSRGRIGHGISQCLDTSANNHCVVVKDSSQTIKLGNVNPSGHSQSGNVYSTDGCATTLCANGGGLGAKTGLYAVAMRGRYSSQDDSIEQQLEVSNREVANALTTVQKDSMVAIPCAYDEQNQYIRKDDCVGTLTTDGSSPKHNNRVVTENLRIRKLTPYECFALMGFDKEDAYKLSANKISNSQLYKMAGNSIVVDVLMAIFRNLYKDVLD